MGKLYRYGQEVNSHDLLKLLALGLMIADHLGGYIFTDSLSLRLVGRGAAPIFFFLVGYSRASKLEVGLFLYGAIITVLSYLLLDRLYINILINFALIRFLFRTFPPEKFPTGMLALCLIILLAGTFPIERHLEYGASGVLLAMAGRFKAVADPRATPLMVFALGYYTLLQIVAFGFGPHRSYLEAIGFGMALMALTFYYYQSREFTFGPLRLPVLICSRYSLHIYFWHLALLQAYALYFIHSHLPQ